MFDPAYRTAFLDWLACAVGGMGERAAVAARGLDDDIVWLGTAGHVLDFDDTYAPGLAHCTAPTAPAALLQGAERGLAMGEVLAAYAAGYEAMAALARASHPELYRRGWHPTAVCGVVGAAAAAARLLGLDRERTAHAIGFALLQSAGLRSAFGSDGKSLQVGLAAAAGARAARLASNGACVSADVRSGFEAAYGATWAESDPAEPAIRDNWIKAYPCCLQTHAVIEAAELARTRGAEDEEIAVRVHPISLQAAPVGVPRDVLQAKFSIPYTAAFTLLQGSPTVESFEKLDDDALGLSGGIRVTSDETLEQSEAVLEVGSETIRIDSALGSPQRPMKDDALHSKVRSLAGDTLEELVADDVPARTVVERLTTGAAT